jgi:hypothetical protein
MSPTNNEQNAGTLYEEHSGKFIPAAISDIKNVQGTTAEKSCTERVVSTTKLSGVTSLRYVPKEFRRQASATM